jgi:hypothetical protein
MAKKQVGRLALRVEGDNWNAYYALPDTMEDAIFLGSIRIGALIDNEPRKQAFMDLMRDVVADGLEEAIGRRPSWTAPKDAPGDERSGSA